MLFVWRWDPVSSNNISSSTSTKTRSDSKDSFDFYCKDYILSNSFSRTKNPLEISSFPDGIAGSSVETSLDDFFLFWMSKISVTN